MFSIDVMSVSAHCNIGTEPFPETNMNANDVDYKTSQAHGKLQSCFRHSLKDKNLQPYKP